MTIEILLPYLAGLVGVPLVNSTAVTNRTPPVARAENWFVAEDGKSRSVASAQTKLPL